MNRSFLAFLLALGALPAAASTIYKCTDEGGAILYTTTKDKNCKVVNSGPDSALPAPPAKSGKSAAANPTPAGFPKVGEDTQKARDNDRRRILEQELASEQKSLEQARKEVSDMEAARLPADRLLPYKERVTQHERNIEAINKELANLK